MEEDNITRQVDEVEALSAIYGSEWCVIDESFRVFCIKICSDGEATKTAAKVCLQVTFPVDYPSLSPPHYQINAAWLRAEDKAQLSSLLEEIYCENVGESIVYLWVERIREFLHEVANKYEQGDGAAQKREILISTETDDGEDGANFEYSDLQLYNFTTLSTDTQPVDDFVCPEIFHGSTLTDRRSTFQPHLAVVAHKAQVEIVLRKLLENKKIQNASHNVVAYRIEHESGFYTGCDDDGEGGAGSRMLHLFQITDVRNVMVVVSRWYGGILLGPDRFKHINNCTRAILEEHHFINKDKDGKRKPNKKEKRR